MWGFIGRCFLVSICLALFTGILVPEQAAFAATSAELMDALNIPSEQVSAHTLYTGTGSSWPPSTVIDDPLCASAMPEEGAILISNGLASDEGLGDTDWGDDGERDFTQFNMTLIVPSWAKSLVFRTRFITSEYDPESGGDVDDKASLQFSWTPCPGLGCMTAPLDLIKVTDSVDKVNPTIPRSINVEGMDTLNLTFIVDDSINGSNDSALRIEDFHFSEHPTVGMYNWEYPPEDVKMSAGTFRYQKNLLKIPGTGIPFDLTIHYKSKQPWSRAMGRKWTHSYEWSLQELENGQIQIRGGDGGSVYFYPDSVSAWTPSSLMLWKGSFITSWEGQSGSLVENPDGTFTYTNRNQMKYHFSSLDVIIGGVPPGVLTAIEDPNGNRMDLSYHSGGTLLGGRLDEIVDTRGNTATFSYTSAAGYNLEQVSYADTLSVSFSYLSTIDSLGTEVFDLAGFSDGEGLTTSLTSDGKGNLLTATDADGIVFINNTYGGETIVTRTDGKGAVDSYSYGDDSVEQTDRLGQIHDRSFDIQDRLVGFTDPLGRIYRYTYDENGNMASQTDPLGNVTTMTHDESGNLLSLTDPLGNTSTINYDGRNNRLSETDALGNTSLFEYDSAENLTRMTDPLGLEVQYAYSGSGQLTQITDRSGNATHLTYTAAGDMMARVDPLGGTVQFAYDTLGRLVSMTDQNGNTATQVHDMNGRVLSNTDPLGFTTGFTYDTQGRLLSMTKPDGGVNSYEYSETGKLVRLTDPLGYEYLSEYDSKDRMTRQTDPLGRETLVEYDAADRITGVTDPLGGEVGAAYDAAGNRISITDPNGNTTGYEYDAMGRVVAETDPLGNRFTNTYEQRGFLDTWTNSKGQSVSYDYDSGGRLVSTSIPSEGYSILHTYNTSGMAIQTEGEGGDTITRSFDAADRIVSRTDEFGNTISYEYDMAGNLVTLTYSDGLQVNYSYDPLNRLVAVSDWDGNTTSYSYDAVGNHISTTLPDGSSVVYSYDLSSRLTTIRDSAPGDLTIYQAAYTLNEIGMRTEAALDLPMQPELADTRHDFTYNAANQLVAMDGQSFSYDPDGNMISGIVGGSSTTLQYDALGRLVSVGDDIYEYDSDGLRKQATVSGQVTRYVQDPSADYPRVLEEHDDKGNIVARYVYGHGLISREDPSGVESIYHFDARGSTVALTDISGNITDRYAYDPYGKGAGQEGSTDNPFQYNGRDGVIDDGNGLYFMRARYYEPTLMRFTQKDNASSATLMSSPSLNRYAFVQGNPIHFVDPNGEVPPQVVGALIGAGVGLTAVLVYDLSRGEWSSWETYAGAAVAGALIGGGFGWLSANGLTFGAAVGGLAKTGALVLSVGVGVVGSFVGNLIAGSDEFLRWTPVALAIGAFTHEWWGFEPDEWAGNLAEDAWDTSSSWVADTASDLWDGITEKADEWTDALVDGLEDGANWVADTAVDGANAVVDFFDDLF